jgi:hypothetical protein
MRWTSNFWEQLIRLLKMNLSPALVVTVFMILIKRSLGTELIPLSRHTNAQPWKEKHSVLRSAPRSGDAKSSRVLNLEEAGGVPLTHSGGNQDAPRQAAWGSAMAR